MKYDEIDAMLESTGIPYEKVDFNQIVTIAPPYMVYYISGEAPFTADGVVYYNELQITIEIVDENDKTENVDKVKMALRENEIFFSVDIDYENNDALKITSLTFTVNE